MATQIEKCADSILRYLQKSSKKEEPAVRFYRAITGASYTDRGRQFFQSYSERQLKSGGIFLTNDSIEQRSAVTSDSYSSEGELERIRRAPGLLVFSTIDETLRWLEGRKYLPGLPALALLEFPREYFKNPALKVFRRYLGEGEQDPRILSARIRMGLLETGAYYLQGARSERVGPTVRRFERILVPNKLNASNTINFTAGFREI